MSESTANTNASPKRRLLSFPQLIPIVVVTILNYTGRVPTPDLAFSLLSIPYVFLLSRFAFPRLSSSGTPPPVFPRDCRLLRVYVSVGGILGLLLPSVYALSGGVGTAAPPLFLLASQVIMEGVSFSYGFSLPARAAVPVVFNAYRLRAITAWVKDEVGREFLAGKALAVANLVFWSFNLFCFLIPLYLPRALDLHYMRAADERRGKKE